MSDSKVFNLVWKYTQLVTGAVLGAISVIVFLVPADVVPQGASGLATLLNHYFGLPIGILILLVNIPILVLAYRMLPGGWMMIADTAVVVVLFGIMVDVIAPFLPEGGFSDDRLLNAVFGGIIGGISGGIVYRTGTNYGGSSVLALILQRKLGLPLSQTFLYIDTGIVVAAGVVFGIEGALYALIVVFLGGVASDYVMEGPSVIRTAFVMTNYPQEVSKAVMEHLHRGVTSLPARGMYSGSDRAMLYITVSRAQVHELRQIVAEVDDHAFLVIGQGHTAYGVGFKPISNRARKKQQEMSQPPLTITVPGMDVPPEDTPLPERVAVADDVPHAAVTVPAVNIAPEDMHLPGRTTDGVPPVH